MAIDVQILTCPLCQREHSAADAKRVAPFIGLDGKVFIPERYFITCTECGTPFYRKVESGADGN